MSEALKPCPFCGDPMIAEGSHGHVAHAKPDESVNCPIRYLVTHMDYWNTRAALPATDEQEFANEKVKALVENLRMAVLWLEYDGRYDTQGMKAALAAMEEDND